jgi:hypothetical protein
MVKEIAMQKSQGNAKQELLMCTEEHDFFVLLRACKHAYSL